jgi:CRISPR-associated Csx14 family protein
MNYKNGLEQLKQLLSGKIGELEFLIYEARLLENLEQERLYGTNEQRRSDRAQIIDQLNSLARQVDTDFNELCQKRQIPLSVPPPNPVQANDNHINNTTSDPSHSSLITPKPKEPKGKNILIASLGESPVVVSATYDWLTKKQSINIDRVIVLHSSDEEVVRACEQMRRVFPDKVELEPLGTKDVNSWVHTCNFLARLYKLLEHAQRYGDRVYLSLAGGRKSMAALMAWVVPYFSCIEGLYHIIDVNENHLLSATKIDLRYRGKFEQIMHPDLDSGEIYLVDIPFERGHLVDKKLIWDIRSPRAANLEKMQYRDQEEDILKQAIVEGRNLLDVQVTKQVYEKFEELRQENKVQAIEIKTCLYQMSDPIQLERGISPDKPYSFAQCPTPLRIFEANNTAQGFVFYTIPATDDEAGKVVVCQLENKVNGKYRQLNKIKASPDFSTTPKYQISDLPAVPYTARANSILIVPLGNKPMVATQLYTLLEQQENRSIREVFLVYPDAQGIKNAARIVKDALENPPYCIPCHGDDPISGLKDILSKDDCRRYQEALEAVIDKACQAAQKYPNCKIDLALSGGRKGMTAMTIFAAQRKNIPYVYHTSIVDENLSERLEEKQDGTVETLKSLSKDKRNARLFLEEYKSTGLFTKFVLFRVPVFPQSFD